MPSDQRSMPTPISTQDMAWEEWTDIPNFTGRYKHLTRAATGSDYHVGMAIEELPPGMRSVPFHYHILEEEHLFILEGRVTLRLGMARYEMSPGDYVCFPAGQKAGHCLINEGDATCRYVVIGERNPNEVCVYPDSNKVLVRALERSVLDLSARRHYWDGEDTGLPAGQRSQASPAPALQSADRPHPPINMRDIAWEDQQIDARFGGQAKHLTMAAVGRSYHVGVMIEAPGPGQRLAPRHYHMVEEEQALILEGEVRLLLGDRQHDLKPGDYVFFPAGVEIGHSFMNIGSGPCRYLMVGERSPHDVCVYPDSNKMALNALRSEDCVFDMAARRRYWDGEAKT
ncbi:cupin domain-containing protein [Dongia rigui]|uniref:Cupin domain-containing protein n=2 Tax=Dongia rigui TaxID=940149 RepID=A0ABU5DXI3_9PROT|nr:cupin domain-containing protein [Dongia rigui]